MMMKPIMDDDLMGRGQQYFYILAGTDGSLFQ